MTPTVKQQSVVAEDAAEDKEAVMLLLLHLPLLPTLMVIINNMAQLVVPERDAIDVKISLSKIMNTNPQYYNHTTISGI
jgi:hypothetical protein